MKLKNRRLEIDILTVFVLLILISSTVIISFTYIKNRSAILDSSKNTIHRVGALIQDRLECLLSDVKIVPQLSTLTYARNPEISESNTVLSSFFLDIIKLHVHLDAFFVGTPDDRFMGVWNFNFLDKSKLSFAVPPGTSFAFLIIDQKSPNEKWIFYNQDLVQVGSHEEPINFFPSKRPWLIDAQKEKHLIWTDFFISYLTNVPIITVATPVYSNSNQIMGVIGANLNLTGLADFIKNQKIGVHGRAFILNDKGEVIVPNGEPDPLDLALIGLAEKSSEENQAIKFQGKTYLVSMKKFPLDNSKSWSIFVQAPFLDFFAGPVRTQHQVVAISILILIASVLLVIVFAKQISKPIVVLSDEVKKIKNLELGSEVRVQSNIQEISLLDASIAAMRSALRSFSRFVPKEIVKKLMQKGQEISLGGEKKELTLFFSDITGLTPIAERLPLDELNELLARYFDGMSRIILKELGTIDKYIGDSVMAFWNAPDEQPDHAVKACVAALKCEEFVAEFNANQKAAGKPELLTRIGINTGLVFVGNIGTSERMNYTVIGDAVNLAQRLEQANKVYQTKILIGEEVVRRIGDQFLVRPADITEIKGKKGKILIYELIDFKDKAKDGEINLVNAFIPAFESYHRGNLSEAKGLFEEVLKKFPNDPITQKYLERIKNPKEG